MRNNMKILQIKTLEKGYHDEDELLLHAAFRVFAIYMEGDGPKLTDWNYNQEDKKAWKEIKFLNRWWTKTRPARRDRDNEFFSELHKTWDGKEKPKVIKERMGRLAVRSGDRENLWYEEDTAMLVRLMKVRKYLWI